MTKRIIKLVSALTTLLLLSACGQKGPLYMPPERDTTDAENERQMTPSETRSEVVQQAVRPPLNDR